MRTATTPERGTVTATTAAGPRTLGLLVLAPLLVGAVACGGTAPTDPAAAPAAPASAGADPAVRPYCDTVARVQAEQTAPQAGQGGVTASSDAARRQVADLVATSPPEIAAEWQTLQSLTEQALGSLAATGGDPNRIDRNALVRLEQEAQPAVTRIQQVTEQRCGITFQPPA
jgi:hypothetical protein